MQLSTLLFKNITEGPSHRKIGHELENEGREGDIRRVKGVVGDDAWNSNSVIKITQVCPSAF